MEQENRHCKKWTPEEDAVLRRYVRARPQNLHQCFMAVGEQTGRTVSAVSGRWYTKVSKEPANVCFFTASPQHVSKNRKNGAGVTTNGNIWRRLMSVIRNIVN
jgi:hypothetical protein